MGKRKPLPTEISGVKIISDCGNGYLHPNSKTQVRLAIVECPECKKHRKVNVYPLKNGDGIYCPSCSNRGSRNGGYKHGENSLDTRTRTNGIWNSMNSRCYSKTNKDYGTYGARGITVCDDWHTDYDAFKAWAGGRLEVADASLERMDNTLGYSPENVIIIPTYLQALNRRNSNMTLGIAIQFARAYEEHGKVKGYTMFYMGLFPMLKDYQVKQFILYNNRKNELLALATIYPELESK